MRGTPLCAPLCVQRPWDGSGASSLPARKQDARLPPCLAPRTPHAGLRRAPYACHGPPYEEVPRIVNLAALPGGPLEVAGYGRLEALVIVGDGELDAFEPTGLQRAEKLLVGRFALGVCNFHADDLPEAIVP